MKKARFWGRRPEDNLSAKYLQEPGTRRQKTQTTRESRNLEEQERKQPRISTQRQAGPGAHRAEQPGKQETQEGARQTSGDDQTHVSRARLLGRCPPVLGSVASTSLGTSWSASIARTPGEKQRECSSFDTSHCSSSARSASPFAQVASRSASPLALSSWDVTKSVFFSRRLRDDSSIDLMSNGSRVWLPRAMVPEPCRCCKPRRLGCAHTHPTS